MPHSVGVIVNPMAGKDIRRLVTAASHTSDSAKVDVVRRAVTAALEIGAERVLVAPDPRRLGHRAIAGLGDRATVLDSAVRGTRDDTIGAATRMWKEDVGALVVLGGDGTCRDVALGWPDAPMIAISTGTNNVFPSPVDATSAGTAAGLVALGVGGLPACRRSKRVRVTITTNGTGTGTATVEDDLALVDLALVDAKFVGARAVLDPARVHVVVASMASPATTGLASIAGRVHPVDRWQPGGVVVWLGPGGRAVRVPLGPGTFTTVEVREVAVLADGEPVELHGPGMLAFDGERDRRIGCDAVVTATVESTGPLLVDVEATLLAAARAGCFDTDHTRLRDGESHDGR